MNTINLVGNITAEPDFFEGSEKMEKKDFTKFSVAVNSYNAETRKYDAVSFWNIKVFGKLAVQSAKNLHKGDSVVIFGELETSEYVAKDGVTKVNYDVFAKNIGRNILF